MAETYIIIVRYPIDTTIETIRWVFFGKIDELAERVKEVKEELEAFYITDYTLEVKQVTQTFEIDISTL